MMQLSARALKEESHPPEYTGVVDAYDNGGGQ